MAEQKVRKIGFKSVVLFKDQTLGIGSYRAVCKAKCDHLVCAAKIIHPTLFDPLARLETAPQRQHRLPMRRFEQECDFLSSIRHPNIILYLGMDQDQESGLPVLLMELMDKSLTDFVESSSQPIPHLTAVNICHDIALALMFLHSNKIVHRDLSSNNVLLRGDVIAKVTDFGMATLSEGNHRATHFTNTMCPGTDVYMPPEAVDESAMYTEKSDCFSFGVIVLQMLTRLFPKPGDRVETISDPRYPRAIKMNIPEIERRKEHIRKVDPNDPLLAVALDCLKDEERERPSAEQLCERMVVLKEKREHSDASSKQVQDDQEAVQALQKNALVDIQEHELREHREEIRRLRQEAARENVAKERQLNRVIHQLEESEKVIADFQRRVIELEGRVRQNERSQIRCDDDGIGADSKTVITLRWQEGNKAPHEMYRWCDAVIIDNITYYVQQEVIGEAKIHAYNTTTSNWSLTPPCPVFRQFAIAVVNETLITIGGIGLKGKVTNQLFSLTGSGRNNEKSWTEEFPPMPTNRFHISALCAGAALIVVGGWKDTSIMKTVEVLNTLTRQWHTVTDLPKPLRLSSMTVCGDRVYLLGGCDANRKWNNSVYSCSLTTLLMSVRGRLVRALSRSSHKWIRVADLPVSRSTAVSLRGHLIAVGGKNSDDQPTSDIHQYDPCSDTWEVISHMATPRAGSLACALPDNQLMVVGGFAESSKNTDSVEFGASL